MNFENIGKLIRNTLEQLVAPILNFLLFCSGFVYFNAPLISAKTNSQIDSPLIPSVSIHNIEAFISLLPITFTDDTILGFKEFVKTHLDKITSGAATAAISSLITLFVILLTLSIFFNLFVEVLARLLRSPTKYVQKNILNYLHENIPFGKNNVKFPLFADFDELLHSFAKFLDEKFDNFKIYGSPKAAEFADEQLNPGTSIALGLHKDKTALAWLCKYDKDGPWTESYDSIANEMKVVKILDQYMLVYAFVYSVLFWINLFYQPNLIHFIHTIVLLFLIYLSKFLIRLSCVNYEIKMSIFLRNSVATYLVIVNK